MKKFISGVVAGALLATTISAYAEDGLEKISAYLRTGLPILLDGKKVELSTPPIVYEGSTYLPLREMAKIFGKEVNWNEKTQSVELGSRENYTTKSVNSNTSNNDSKTATIYSTDKSAITAPLNRTNTDLNNVKFGETIENDVVKISLYGYEKEIQYFGKIENNYEKARFKALVEFKKDLFSEKPKITYSYIFEDDASVQDMNRSYPSIYMKKSAYHKGESEEAEIDMGLARRHIVGVSIIFTYYKTQDPNDLVNYKSRWYFQ